MLKRIKPQFLFSVFLILTLIFFAALIGCTSGQMIINIPMATDDIVGIWEGDLSLADRNGLLYESVLEIAVNDELCFATFTAVENEESEISGFGNILMEGRVAENRLLLISRNNTQEITYEATFAFANLKKTILSGLISRHSTESTDNRAAIDTWQGDLDKRIDPDNSPIVFED